MAYVYTVFQLIHPSTRIVRTYICVLDVQHTVCVYVRMYVLVVLVSPTHVVTVLSFVVQGFDPEVWEIPLLVPPVWLGGTPSGICKIECHLWWYLHAE